MVHAGAVQTFAVMVHRHLTVDYLVAPIAIHIGHTQVMVALSGIGFVAWSVGVEHPLRLQFLTVPVKCGQYASGIISTAHHHAGMSAVQIGDAGQETVAAIGVSITPVLQIAALRDIVYGRHLRSGFSVEHSQVLRPCDYSALHVAPVGSAVTDHLALAILCAVGCL